MPGWSLAVLLGWGVTRCQAGAWRSQGGAAVGVHQCGIGAGLDLQMGLGKWRTKLRSGGSSPTIPAP